MSYPVIYVFRKTDINFGEIERALHETDNYYLTCSIPSHHLLIASDQAFSIVSKKFLKDETPDHRKILDFLDGFFTNFAADFRKI